MKTTLIRWSRIVAILTGSLLAGACAMEHGDYAYNSDSNYYGYGTSLHMAGVRATAPVVYVGAPEPCSPVLRGDAWMPCECLY